MAGEGVTAFLDYSHCWGARGKKHRLVRGSMFNRDT